MKNRFLILAGLILIPSLVFAGGKGDNQENQARDARYKTIIDSRGVEVKVPVHVQKIATFPLPHPHIIAAIDGGVDRIKGASSMSVSAAKISVFGKMYPELFNVETGYLKGLNLNVEELARIEPDVFFTDKVLQGMENLESTGIPVVHMGLLKEKIPYKGGQAEVYSPRTTMVDWVKITSEVLGNNKSNALEIADVWADTEKEIEQKLKDVPENKRVKVLIMFKTKAMLIAGNGTFGHYWIGRTGGINAAEELKGKHPAMIKGGTFEDIMKWNPDVIYLSNFEDTMPEDLYNNTIDGQDWSRIAAVINKRVYRIPLGIYRWYPPSLDGPLMLKWMAQKNYPDLFKYDMEKEIKKYFEKYHHYELGNEEIKGILDPASSGNL